MIIILIVCGILYLLMVYSVISLYYTYRKDIEELEKRFLVLEKRTSHEKEIDVILKEMEENQKEFEKCITWLNVPENMKIETGKYGSVKITKEGDNMACKKGRGGRKK